MNTPRIPQTDSIQELAKFWGDHDLTEYEDELEEVPEQVFERADEKATVITVHLDNDEARALRDMAASRGLGDSELIRQWVLDRIHAK